MANARIITINDLNEAKMQISNIGVDVGGLGWLAPKAVHINILLEDISPLAANILKQEMLGKGGDAAVHRGVANCSEQSSNVLLMGSYNQYIKLLYKLKMQSGSLKVIAEEIQKILEAFDGKKPEPLVLKNRNLPVYDRTLVMGILNVTPDSFSDGGSYTTIERAVNKAREMVSFGADLIDVGGESTRPDHAPVHPQEEINRVLPVVEKLLGEIDIPISVDTQKAQVAEKVLLAGAHIINDVWGLQKDPKIAEVIARYGAGVIVMHNSEHTEYKDLMGDIIRYLRKSVDIAIKSGIDQKSIIVDPGIGFGKTVEQNLEVMNRLKELRVLNLPILLGTSRKSVIGKILELPVNERLEGTAATVTLGISKGVNIVRVHDVKEIIRVARMTDAMIKL